MVKLKGPLHSLDARGTISKAVSFVNRRQQKIAEIKPEILDVQSTAQLSWRHMFNKCTALWHALSAAEQAEWESLARSRHMTGYAYWQSQCLRPNPGIYLPLQGGTMQGNIDMAGFKIEDLPDPIANQEADTRAARDAAIATHTADLDAHMADIFQTLRTGEYMFPLPFHTTSLAAITANTLYAILFVIIRPLTVDRITIRVTTLAAGASARLGIYNNDGLNLYPGTPLLDAGIVSVATVGVKSIIINQSLARGIYFAAIVSDGTPVIVKHRLVMSPLGIWEDNLQLTKGGWSVAQAYGALPNPFTAGATMFPQQSPCILLRLLSLD